MSAVPSKLALPATSPLTCIVLAVSKAVAVSALPVISPVTLPSKLPTKVATVYPVPLVFTVVVGSSSRSLNILNLPSPVSLNKPAYKVVPLGAYLP